MAKNARFDEGEPASARRRLSLAVAEGGQDRQRAGHQQLAPQRPAELAALDEGVHEQEGRRAPASATLTTSSRARGARRGRRPAGSWRPGDEDERTRSER